MCMGQPHQTIVMLHTYYVGSSFCNSKEGSSLHLLLFEMLPFPGDLFIGQKSSSPKSKGKKVALDRLPPPCTFIIES